MLRTADWGSLSDFRNNLSVPSSNVSWMACPLRTGLTGFPNTSLNNYRSVKSHNSNISNFGIHDDRGFKNIYHHTWTGSVRPNHEVYNLAFPTFTENERLGFDIVSEERTESFFMVTALCLHAHGRHFTSLHQSTVLQDGKSQTTSRCSKKDASNLFKT
jgi:hypothetical protein